MLLFNEISKNEALQFVDDHGQQQYTLRDIGGITPTAERQLAFLYIDNAWPSVKMLLAFLKSDTYAIALLSPALAQQFKADLEHLYIPSIIVDFSRKEIPGYTFKEEEHFFIVNEPASIEMHSDIKVLLSTSGTTGSPKFVKLSEANLLENARSITAYLPISHSDVTPLNLPVYYSYGLSILTSNALKGGTIVCSNTDMLHADFWKKMATYGYTSIAGVPFVYEMLQRIGFTKKEYPSLKYFTQAGGKLQDALVEKFAEYAQARNIRFYVMYGQTEATARMSYLPPDKTLTKMGSIGVAIPGGAFNIAEETSELLYSGPNIFGGYVSTPADLRSFRQEHWLHTGDMARVDDDGYYYITGRLKRFAKIFGSRINLDEVEQMLAKGFSGGVRCMGIDDKALLLVSDNEAMDMKAAAAFVTGTLKLHPTVVKTMTVAQMPLTPNGKPDYSALRKIYTEQ